MSKDSEHEEIVDTPKAPEEKKQEQGKSHLNRNLLLLLILGGAIYAFYSDSPAIKNLKSYFGSSSDQSLVLDAPLEPSEPEETEDNAEPVAETVEPEDENAPIFDQNIGIDEYASNQQADDTNKIIYEDLKAASAAISELQHQIETLQHTVNLMHAHQVEQGQQLVSSRLFDLLQQAAVPQNNLLQSATLWKSISFLPLLSDEKRSAAKLGYDQLKELHHTIIATADELDSISVMLQKQIEPESSEQKSTPEVEAQAPVDPYQVVEAETSWTDWLLQQFKLSKVDPDTLITPEDPYIEQKQLIRELQTLKATLIENRWQDIGTLNKLFYQLEQRGIETSLDHETIHNFEQVYQTWQTKAEKWMEQL